MNEWTSAARDTLERYLAESRNNLKDSEADPAEVADDLRRHIEAELAGLRVVTETEVRRVLERLGTAEAGIAPQPRADSPPALPSGKGPRLEPGYVLLVFAVILPLLTLGMELFTGMCAAAFFDPLPTWGHILMVAAVPWVNFRVWWRLRQEKPEFSGYLPWGNAIVLGVALVYTLAFLPLMPFAMLGILYFGFGFLPLAPFFSFLGASLLRLELRKQWPAHGGGKLPGLAAGLGITLALMLAIELPSIVTKLGVQMALEENPDTQIRGLHWLRSWGQEETLLRACYGRGTMASRTDLLGWIIPDYRRLTPELARPLYYRVMGKAFNSVPPPKIRTARGIWAELDEFSWDNDQGGAEVGGRVKGLALRSSRLDAIADAEAVCGYCEWTMEFENRSSQQREARAQIVLPPGGVVSRLTLWINGEEREAAFGGRNQVREAYRQVVQRRRDPVLVTTCGPDRVLVQCFPVPPNGGVMKVRLGISAPLVLQDPSRAIWNWPCLVERNFAILPTFSHSLWLDSPNAQELKSELLSGEKNAQNRWTGRGQANESTLLSRRAQVWIRRDPAQRTVWVSDAKAAAPAVIQQELMESAPTAQARLVIVVDGSAEMKSTASMLGKALAELGAPSTVAVLLASDQVLNLAIPGNPPNQTSPTNSAIRLDPQLFAGGQDNLPALEQAWDLAAVSNSNGAVVWIHGSQPTSLGSAENLRQRFERQGGRVTLVDFSVRPGPNRILEMLDGLPDVVAAPRTADLARDLTNLWRRLRGGNRQTVLRRQRLSPESVTAGLSDASQVVRLWARDVIEQLRRDRQVDQAVEMARRYQLVTPVSGAVVLETRQQYEQAGLEPVAPDTVPSIPEPSAYLLVILGSGLLWGWGRIHGHRQVKR